MSQEKKERVMTPRGFLSKLNTKAANSAAGFLQAHRDFLTAGELASLTSPILARLDRGEILPTPAKQEIAATVLGHIIALDRQKLEEKLEKLSQPVTSKPWVATIYDGKDIIQTHVTEEGNEEDLVKGFEHASDADRWSDRRLFEGASDWYAIVEGCNTMIRIERADAIARILKKVKGAVCQRKKQSTDKLGFGVKASQDRASFSRG